jgi:hypothetical protein
MPLRTYDAAQVAMVFAGIPLSGLADGTFVTIEQNSDSFALVVGADGEACRSKTNNRSGKVTFRLLQSSQANDLLSALHNVDIDSPSGDGIGPLLVKDNSGRTLVTAEKAWIMKQPSAAFARDTETREWVIETDRLAGFHGGN